MKRFLGLASVILIGSAGCATSPMVRAVSRGTPADVTALLEQGYDINAKTGRAQMTALELAVDLRRADIALSLLERGADVNIRHNGTSALSIAAINGDKEMTRLLLSKGAEATAREIKWAQGPDRAEIVAMLEKAAKPPAVSSSRPEAPVGVEASTQPASDVDIPAYKTGERSDDFALVVGIGRYMDGPEARFSAHDAEAVRGHLVALGWPSRNIISLSAKAAGRAGLGKYLERWLPNNVVANSRIFFYFAGSGAVDAAGQAYLLPWDGDPAQLEATGYPLSRLYAKLNALKARSVIAVLDADFSGSGPRAFPLSKNRKAPERVDLDPKDLGDVVVLAASAGVEPAGVLESERHGTLTYFFLKGLNGAAADANGIVTIKGLFRYAREGRSQTPRLLTGDLGEADLRLR